MSDKPAFAVNVAALKSKPKETGGQRMAAVDAVAQEQGFVPREGQGRRGRKPSPRTGQVHAKVMPDVSDAIAMEAQRRGVTQGVLIEEAWALYEANAR